MYSPEHLVECWAKVLFIKVPIFGHVNTGNVNMH